MFKTLVIVVVVVVLGVLGLAAFQPETFTVQRQINVSAPPDKPFALVNDFHRWGEWSPWEALDPAMKRSHAGPTSGPGAIYQWEGNKAVGAGRMEITGAQPANVSRSNSTSCGRSRATTPRSSHSRRKVRPPP